ncbi:hypothetical protein GCM10028793_28650 [Nocardiopsis oceani]
MDTPFLVRWKAALAPTIPPPTTIASMRPTLPRPGPPDKPFGPRAGPGNRVSGRDRLRHPRRDPAPFSFLFQEVAWTDTTTTVSP